MENLKNMFAPALFVGLLALLVAVVIGTPAGAADDAAQKAFMDNGCNKCHAISTLGIEAKIKSEKMQGPDLAKVGERHDAVWIKKYLLKEVDMNDQMHKAKWDGSETELGAVVEWLAAMK